MLLLLISFYVHYDLLNCEENVKAYTHSGPVSTLTEDRRCANLTLKSIPEFNVKETSKNVNVATNKTVIGDNNIQRLQSTVETLNAKLNESSLVDGHHLKLLHVNALLVDLEVKTRKLSALLADDHQPHVIGRKTNALRDLILRNLMSKNDQNHQNPINFKKPLHSLATPVYEPFEGVYATTSPYPVSSGPHSPPPSNQPVHWAYPLPSTFPESNLQNLPSLYVTSFTPSSTTTLWPKIQQITFTPHTASSAKKAISLAPEAREWFKNIAPYTPVKKKWRKTSRNRTEATMHIPGQTPEDPYKVWTTKITTAGDVLYGKIKVQDPSSTQPPNPRYLGLMRELNEGYLMVFGMEMFRLIAVKDKREVQEVLGHVETIYNTSLRSGRLVGVNKSFLTILGNLAIMTSEDEIDTLRTYSSMMFHTLLKRKEVLSPEVNSMIDQAGLSYNNAEGNRLFCSLSHFEDYPNTHKSSYSVCEGLIDSILQPIRRPLALKNSQALLSSINKVLRDNFPEILRDRSLGTPTTLSLIGTTISRIGTRPRKRKKKHHHHKKKKRKRKRRRKPVYDINQQNTRPNSQDLYYQQPSIVEPFTTNRYRPMKGRPTKAIIWPLNPSPTPHLPLTYPSPTPHLPLTYPSPTPSIYRLADIPTKIIARRKLVHHRNAMLRRQRKQTGHARVATPSTRTPRYQETFLKTGTA